jgi:hypothetical protein
MGNEDTVVDGALRRRRHLDSVDLASGRWVGWDLAGERALP